MPRTLSQFVIDKQGILLKSTWTSRVLTFDPEYRCVYLSRRDHPEQLCYHRMQVTSIQAWPEYDPKRVRDPPDSAAAKLSFCVTGENSTKVEKAPPTSTDAAPSTRSREASATTVEQLRSGTFVSVGEETWVLRCCSAHELKRVLGSFSEFILATSGTREESANVKIEVRSNQRDHHISKPEREEGDADPTSGNDSHAKQEV